MKNFILLALVCAAVGCFAQGGSEINPPALSLDSITVTASSSTIIAGGKATLTALAISSMQQNINLTYQCTWSSGNLSILTVSSAGIVTGVGVGTTSAVCTDNGISGLIQITVAATPLITTPAPGSCGTPCVLPQVTGGAAYSFTFTAVGGLLPYTWDCNGSCSGIFPSGLSLSSSGVLSGTTSTAGTTLWTLRVCDSTPMCTTEAMSLTVVAGTTCSGSPGPPNYPCSPVGTGANPGNISYLFVSTTSTGKVNTVGTATTWVSGTQFSLGWTNPLNINGVAYTGYTVNSATSITLPVSAGTHTGVAYFLCTGDCQNAVKEDTTIPGHVAGTDKITRISDEATLCGPGGFPVGNMTLSGGGSDHMISIAKGDGTYHLYVNRSGGGVCHYHLTLAGGQVQVINSGVVPLQIVNGGAFSTSSVNSERFYDVSGSQLLQGDLTSDSTFASTPLKDIYGAGICPGVPVGYGSAWHSVLNVDKLDDTLILSMGPTGQGRSDWVFAWSQTKGCSTANMNTGQAWAFCPSGCAPSTPPLTNPLTGIPTFLANLSTTTFAGVSVTGSQYVNSATTNMFVGQSLVVDTGASQETVVVIALGQNSRGFGPCSGGGAFSCFEANFTKTHLTGFAVTYTSTTCWGSNGAGSAGIHDVLASVNGDYADIALQAGWSQGGCGGLGSSPGPSFWQVGTTNDQWCSNLIDPGCGGHQSVGTLNLLTPGRGGASGPDLVSLANMATRSIFFPTLAITDLHCSWPHLVGGAFNETLPWVCGGDSATTGQPACIGGNGTSPVYCPIYLQNQIFLLSQSATYPPGQAKLVAHTGACGPAGTTYAQCNDGIADVFGPANAIGSASPDGKFFCWVSSMWHQIGLDNNGLRRADAFCVMLQ